MLVLIIESSVGSAYIITFAEVPMAKAKLRVNMAEVCRVWISGNIIHWNH